MNPNDNNLRRVHADNYLSIFTLLLNSSNRTQLTNDQHGGDLQAPPTSSLPFLFKNDDIRQSLRETIHKSIGSHLVVDATNLGSLRLRLSEIAPPSHSVERGLDDQSIDFHAKAVHIGDASDGTRAFIGILTEIKAGDPKLLFIDEPEAFLHPSLAFDLGREISKSVYGSDKKVFVSTHSPQFVMGCIQSGVPVNIVRLTYNKGSATARLLPSDSISSLMRNPLLRSIGVISALFYQNVIVTEADPDRAFYQEINERLLSVGRGIQNTIFLNAQNKQTIPTIVDPLRRLGIPTAAIYDIDFIKDSGGVAKRFMDSACIPQLAQNGLSMTRASVYKALETTGKNYKMAGGVSVLPSDERAAADDYFGQLAEYGAFVVRRGELESWLPELGVKGHGPSWLIPMFERLGEDSKLETYVHPTEGDVWEFIDNIGKWLTNPTRKGIPA